MLMTSRALLQSRRLREDRSIPQLIYAIEQFERNLIQLSRVARVDLMTHFRLSTSRDFRIQADVISEAMEEEEEEEEEASDAEPA